MADYVYGTDHGSFLITAKNKEKLREALLASYETPPEETSVRDLLMSVGYEPEEDQNGDIIDLYLTDCSYSSEEWAYLMETVGPFVEPGSYLVFAFGGCNGCWAITFDHDETKMETVGREQDVVTVLLPDLIKLLKETRDNPTTKQLAKKYGVPIGA